MPTHQNSRGTKLLWAFFGLACAITWLCDLPYVLAQWATKPPAAYALLLGGLGAFGPSLAAIVVSDSSRRWHSFLSWKTHPGWVVAALLLPMTVNLLTTGLNAIGGGSFT